MSIGHGEVTLRGYRILLGEGVMTLRVYFFSVSSFQFEMATGGIAVKVHPSKPKPDSGFLYK